MKSTYNPKLKHVKREDLKVGMVVVCGDDVAKLKGISVDRLRIKE